MFKVAPVIRDIKFPPKKYGGSERIAYYLSKAQTGF
jgi:hypothetical protein